MVKKHIKRLFITTLLVALSGCAAAYHNYPCGSVPYGYCPPPPLPYADYPGCPTPVATICVGSKVAKPVVSDQSDAESSAGDSSSP